MAYEREYGGYGGFGGYDPNDPFNTQRVPRQQSQTGAYGPSPTSYMPRLPLPMPPQAPSPGGGGGAMAPAPSGGGVMTPSQPAVRALSPAPSMGSAEPDRGVGVQTPTRSLLERIITQAQIPLSPYQTAAYGQPSQQSQRPAAAPPQSPTPNNVATGNFDPNNPAYRDFPLPPGAGGQAYMPGVPPPSQGGPPAPAGQPGTITGDGRGGWPGHHFVQGVGWVQDGQPEGSNPYGSDERGRPTFDPSRLPPTSSYPNVIRPATIPGQPESGLPAAPPVQGTSPDGTGSTTEPGYITVTNDVGDKYTVPADWGPFRGQMRGYSTANYDARGAYTNGSGEFGRQTAIARIVSHIDPKAPDAHAQLEAAMTKAGIKWVRNNDGTYSFSEVGKPNQAGVHLLKNGQWTWIDHAKLGAKGGGPSGDGGGPQGANGGVPVGSYGADAGTMGNGQPNYLDPTSAGNNAFLQWLINGMQGNGPGRNDQRGF